MARAAGYAWRTLADGSVWLGADAWATYTPAGEVDVIDEQPEWQPGTPGMVTVTLEPGNYVVMCNIAGHYAQGMYADLVVVAQP